MNLLIQTLSLKASKSTFAVFDKFALIVPWAKDHCFLLLVLTAPLKTNQLCILHILRSFILHDYSTLRLIHTLIMKILFSPGPITLKLSFLRSFLKLITYLRPFFLKILLGLVRYLLTSDTLPYHFCRRSNCSELTLESP